MSRVQLQILLGTIFAVISGVLLIVVGLSEEERMGTFEEYQTAQAIEVGAELFETNCRGCHGLRGEGIPGLAPPLNDAQFFMTRVDEVGWEGSLEDYVVATISTGRQISTRPDLYPGAGRPAMPTWSERFGGPLREDQIQSLATFIMNWESTATGDVELVDLPTPTPSAADAADPVARGRVVYDTSGCGGCHTIEGISSGAVGPPLTNIATVGETRVDGVTAEEYIRQSILNPSAYLVDGYDNLMVQTFADTITDEQLSDLVAFLLAQE
jgi:mono/diheme cytochrome c family protein